MPMVMPPHAGAVGCAPAQVNRMQLDPARYHTSQQGVSAAGEQGSSAVGVCGGPGGWNGGRGGVGVGGWLEGGRGGCKMPPSALASPG